MAMLDTPRNRVGGPAPAAPPDGRAAVLDSLGEVRERTADFLSRPGMPTLRAMIDGAQRFLNQETRLVLSGPDGTGLDEHEEAELQESHGRLVELLNAMVWEVPGSAQLSEVTMAFRHALLRHLDLYAPPRRR